MKRVAKYLICAGLLSPLILLLIMSAAPQLVIAGYTYYGTSGGPGSFTTLKATGAAVLQDSLSVDGTVTVGATITTTDDLVVQDALSVDGTLTTGATISTTTNIICGSAVGATVFTSSQTAMNVSFVLQDASKKFLFVDESSNQVATIDAAGMIDVKGGVTVLKSTPGSDTDVSIIQVAVTGTPTLSWDESEDEFDLSHHLNLGTKYLYAKYAIGTDGVWGLKFRPYTAAANNRIALANDSYVILFENSSGSGLAEVTPGSTIHVLDGATLAGIFGLTGATIEMGSSTGDLLITAADASDIEVGNTVILSDMIKLPTKTADPCDGATTIGMIFYTGDGNGFVCYCNDAGNDLLIHDNNACTYP